MVPRSLINRSTTIELLPLISFYFVYPKKDSKYFFDEDKPADGRNG
jgi:hypothetical protein